ncbi:hypothetical protein CL653_03345 [bacterium]|nr:hypothetical protein [bacterium]|tara:strand:+ start:183 stop:680 length:498 start_codon:yes stop_codon:yes gene_type:complete
MSQGKKLPIFQVLSRFDKRDLNVRSDYKNGELQEFDKFVGYPALLWMSAADDDVQHMMCLITASEIAENYFEQHANKPLQAKLLASAGIGERVKHKFPKPLKSSRPTKLYEVIYALYPDLDDGDCKLLLSRADVDDIQKLAESSGLYNDKKQIKAVVDEFKKHRM